MLVFFHGGGWVIGDLESHDGVCRHRAAEALPATSLAADPSAPCECWQIQWIGIGRAIDHLSR